MNQQKRAYDVVVDDEALERVDSVEGKEDEEERVGEESSAAVGVLCVEGSIVVAGDFFELLDVEEEVVDGAAEVECVEEQRDAE